ncbi:645_t:CDS:1 [Paraglomus occultum]|uniref:645_t:CDS:1 n=1 Tax=Paraglomus occultum TaxID=144539 RepID=A0A9N9H1A2_9GLOM|nr:645_t:CDS:1 [Paraglomus occultum]
MASLSERRGTDCTDAEWDEYIEMPQVCTNKTPSEWMKRIWARLTYFRENDLLPNQSKKYLEARKLIRFPNGGSYAPEIGIAICFSCDRLVYTGQRKKNIGNYNHIGMERHWKFACAGNKYCGVNYEKYSEIKQKSNFKRNYDEEYALHRYELWEWNAMQSEDSNAQGKLVKEFKRA